jgi:hypothetical protein
MKRRRPPRGAASREPVLEGAGRAWGKIPDESRLPRTAKRPERSPAAVAFAGLGFVPDAQLWWDVSSLRVPHDSWEYEAPAESHFHSARREPRTPLSLAEHRAIRISARHPDGLIMVHDSTKAVRFGPQQGHNITPEKNW